MPGGNQTERGSRSLLKRIPVSLIALILVIGLVAWGVYYWLISGSDEKGWLIQYAEIGSIENHVASTGTLEPKNYVDVGAQVSGQVKVIHVEEGDVVEKGQLLAEIDASVFETKVANAEASLENKRAGLQQQLAELELEELRLRRNEGLFTHQAISEDTLVQSRTGVKILKAKIEATRAQIKADEASLAGDKVSLGYTSLFAPISGTVASISVREGQTLNATNSAPVVMKISDLSVMTLRVEVSEADIPKLQKGMDVRFATLGQPYKYRWSTLAKILPTPNVVNDVVLYQVLVDVDNKDHSLMEAMSTQVFFVEESAQDVLLVPLAAVRRTPRGAFARVPAGNEEERVKVELGIVSRTHAQIRAGLELGDAVIAGSEQSSGGEQARTFGNTSTPRIGGRRGF